MHQTGLSRYARAVDRASGALGPAHEAILAAVPGAADVLDVGCSSGYLAARLAERSCTVVGIELDPADAAAAERHCQRVIQGDIEQLDLSAALGPLAFDVIVLGDVLEHLRAPESALSTLRAHLKPRGKFVVSIPNVAHASLRLQLLLGEFRYEPVGLLDETHLRFFTLASFLELAWGVGLAPAGVTRIEEPINPELWAAVVGRLGLEDDTADRLAQLLREPSAAAFQYVLELVPVSAEAGSPPPFRERPVWSRSLTEVVEQRDRTIKELQAQLAEQTAWAQTATAQVAARDQTIKELQARRAGRSARG